MQIQVSRPAQASDLHRDLATVATRSGSGELTALNLEVHPKGVPSVQQALSTHDIGGVFPVTPLMEPVKFSFDASVTEHLFGTDAELGIDLSSLLAHAKVKESTTKDKDSSTGIVTTRRIIEGALGGAAAR